MSDTEQTRMMGSTVMPGGDRTMVAPPGGVNATLQMPAAGFDPSRTQIGGTATCLICGTVTPLMETYCGECGFLLASAPPVGKVETPQPEAPAAELVDSTDGRRYRLRAGNNTLGRQGTDILIMEGTISRTHASIQVENGLVTITDLGSSNGTKVGDTRLGANQPTIATSGTPLKFGSWRCTLEIGADASAGNADQTVMANRTVMATPVDATVMDPGFSTEPPTANPLVLDTAPASAASAITMLQKQSGPGDDIPLPGGTVTLGRKAGNNVILTEDPYISGKHAELMADETGIYLTDLGSTNGTVVNGQKLAAHELLLLTEGDEIQIGRTKYRLILGNAAESDAGDHTAFGESAPSTLGEQVDELRNLTPHYDPNSSSELLPPQ